MSVVANVAINIDSRDAVSKLRQVQSQASATEKAFDGINRTAIGLRSALAGVGIAGIVAQTTRAAASFNDLQLRLKLLTGQYGETARAQDIVAKSSKTFGLSTREATAGIANIYARLRPLGVSLKDIETTFTGFNTVAKLSGVGAAEASSAFTQLAQALGSGRLQGDEFRSISEQVPGILVAISKETGIAAGNLKDYAKEGNITSEIVINALARIEKEGAGKIAKIIQDSDVQKFKNFQNAVDDLSIAIGNDLLPTVTPLIQEATKLVRAIAALPQPVKSAALDLAKLGAAIFLLSKAIQGVIALRAGLVGAMVAMGGATAATGVAAKTSSGAFALYTANAKTLQLQSLAATGAVSGLSAALLGLAAIGIITVGVNYVVTQVGEVFGSAAAAGRSEKAGTQKSLAEQLKGKSEKERKQMLAQAQKNLANDKKLLTTLNAKIVSQQAEASFGDPGVGPLPSDLSQRVAIQARIKTNQARIKAIQSAPALVGGTNRPPIPTPTPLGTGQDETGGKGKGNSDAERLAEQIASQKAAAAELLATEKGRLTVAQTAEPLQRLITEAIVQQNDIQRQYADKLKESKSAEETLNLQIAERNALQTNALELQRTLSEETDRIVDPLKQLTDASAERLQFENKYQELLSQGINPELAKEFAQLELTAEKQTQILTLRLAELEGAKAKLQAESDVAKALQEQIDKIKEIMRLQGQAVAKSKQESEDEKKKREERERRDQDSKNQAERLKNLYSGVVNTIEDGIVNAISVGIEGLINGTKQLDQALKEIAAGVLQDIGKQLVRFGVNSLMRGVFPGAFAKGGVFAANGIQPFAAGGIVNTPTLFPFAEGGAARTGLMGEAGPEAIMPLSRNSDGRLGVDASGLREAMGSASGSASAPVLNMSFQSTNIGGVEYVSRDQLEAAMAATRRQASRDGAKRGMSMTLDRLQQSPQTRNRIGIR